MKVAFVIIGICFVQLLAAAWGAPQDKLSIGWNWVQRDAGVLPYGCQFVYGGGSNRLLYVGRVRNGRDILPAAIHHYGAAGSETARYIGPNDEITVAKTVEWLCADGTLASVGWSRVPDLSSKTLIVRRALPIGYDSNRSQHVYGCLVHSFFSDTYPASLGVVRDGHCIFEVKGKVVSSADFTWWHTIELLVAA